jgi:hypothetical protein
LQANYTAPLPLAVYKSKPQGLLRDASLEHIVCDGFYNGLDAAILDNMKRNTLPANQGERINYHRLTGFFPPKQILAVAYSRQKGRNSAM